MGVQGRVRYPATCRIHAVHATAGHRTDLRVAWKRCDARRVRPRMEKWEAGCRTLRLHRTVAPHPDSATISATSHTFFLRKLAFLSFACCNSRFNRSAFLRNFAFVNLSNTSFPTPNRL